MVNRTTIIVFVSTAVKAARLFKNRIIIAAEFYLFCNTKIRRVFQSPYNLTVILRIIGLSGLVNKTGVKLFSVVY